MSSFTDYYKKNLFKQSGGQRLAAIDFLIADLISEMQSVVDPTKWNILLEEKEKLEMERKEIVSDQGEFKMQ